MARVPQIFTVILNSQDVTSAIASSITALSYTDIFASGAATLDFEVLSTSPYLPQLGQFIEIKFGYADTPGTTISTGTMRVDDVVQGYSPDTVKAGAIAWESPTEGWSEGYSFGYTNFDLRRIIADNATKLGLALNTLPNPLPADLIIGTTTIQSATNNSVVIQGTQGRYRLLADIAKQYGYLFQVKNGTLFFRRIAEVRSQAAISTMPKNALMPGVSFHLSNTGLLKSVDISTKSGSTTNYVDNSVPTNIATKAQLDNYYENLIATSARKDGLFLERNANQLTAKVRIPGSILYQAALTVNLSGFTTNFNRKYLITKVTHTLNPSGWMTDLDLQLAA